MDYEREKGCVKKGSDGKLRKQTICVNLYIIKTQVSVRNILFTICVVRVCIVPGNLLFKKQAIKGV